MGKTSRMKRHEKILRERRLKGEEDSGVTVLTEEMKELAGMNNKVVPSFSGGTAGLRKVKKKDSDNWWE